MTLLQTLLLCLLLAAAAYGVYEIRRWRTPEGQASLSSRQRILRSWGLFFLLLALGLWLRGTFLPVPPSPARTRQERQALLRSLEYWTLTSLAALPLVPLALLDARENLRRLAAERKQNRREAMTGLPLDGSD
ncbi:MAG: hypothetical protein M3Y13_00425 [Armatimonadota bacterium]|nr:hypothetical protein [Armatimonadota bacterium]